MRFTSQASTLALAFTSTLVVNGANCGSVPRANETVSVNTPNGRISGFIDRSYTPNVEQYLGIPYAQPPVGALRFAPPIPKNVTGNFDAVTRQPSCSQWLTKLPTIVNLTPEFVPPAPFSEDCLYLNIFKPKTKKHGKALPVVVWIHGGVLIWGGTNDYGEFPMRWVERSQEHIFVQVNYRLNVFGYPNAAGLSDDQQNAGVKDARLALEWVRANIASFGGDPDHIIMQGQSAGSALVDILEYGYQSDPVAIGAIHESAVASMLNGTASDPNGTHTAFTELAQHLGCPTNDSAQELECMRGIDQQKISNFLQEYNDAGTMPEINFSPIADGKTVFTPKQYAEKYSTSKLPVILGFNSDEGATFVPYTSPANPGATPQAIEDLTLWEVQCAVVTAARQRYAGNASTFFYYYSGNFTNISPEPWMGSYHFSELPLVFGSHQDLKPRSTAYEFEVSHAMQDLWLAFIKDPKRGLLKKSWPTYSPAGQLMHIAPHGKDQPATRVESAKWVGDECATVPAL